MAGRWDRTVTLKAKFRVIMNSGWKICQRDNAKKKSPLQKSKRLSRTLLYHHGFTPRLGLTSQTISAVSGKVNIYQLHKVSKLVKCALPCHGKVFFCAPSGNFFLWLFDHLPVAWKCFLCVGCCHGLNHSSRSCCRALRDFGSAGGHANGWLPWVLAQSSWNVMCSQRTRCRLSGRPRDLTTGEQSALEVKFSRL